MRESLKKLNKLSLEIVSGGKQSSVLVVRGLAKHLLKALDLTEVINATVDRLITLPNIAPEKAITRIAKLYIKILWKNQDVQERQKSLVYQAAEQYIINYDKLHNKLRILDMEKSVDLESIYTAVKIVNSQGILCERQEGIAIANQEQYLMVLGQPGSGKSTFLRKVGLEALKLTTGTFQHECIPVFIELKRLAKSNFSIKKAIIREFQERNFPEVKDFINLALQKCKLLILLDGLDEVATDYKNQVVEDIKKIVSNYSQNRFIISCRTPADRNYFHDFTKVFIADFDDKQIDSFINNWFRSYEDTEAETAKACWQLLNKPEYKSTKELAKTPLLLTFLCLVYGDSQGFPQNRANIYKEALDILLKKWAAQKRIKQDPTLREFGLEREILLLSEIAYKGFKANKLYFSREELLNQIQNFIDNNLNISQQLESDEVLDSI
ncbi:MAG: NACHT domain-containing protein, partial [Cyanobacteria bacterium P01_F01_bin.143]